MKGHIPGTLSKAAVLARHAQGVVHGPDPLIQKLPFGPVLLIVQVFCFKDEMFLIDQPDDKVRIIFSTVEFMIGF